MKIKTAWENGARDAGRDPRKLSIVVEHWAVVGDQREAKRMAEKWRFVAKAWEKGYFDNISPMAIQQSAEKEIPLENVIEKWPVSTKAEIHINAIEQLIDLGATHIVVHGGSSNQKKVIDFFGRKVLPEIRTR
jgi:coenzyme F420-dependent glucose-6-phosphate dehydrogenase